MREPNFAWLTTEPSHHFSVRGKSSLERKHSDASARRHNHPEAGTYQPRSA
jgi:hypothetical protein